MEYHIEEKPAFRIVGVKREIPLNSADFDASAEEGFQLVPEFWAETVSVGLLPKIVELMDAEPRAILGVNTCNEREPNYYYISVASNKPAPPDMDAFLVPACTWAIFPGSGTNKSLIELQRRIVQEWLPTSGYEWAQAPDVEVYIKADPTDTVFEVWLPVKKTMA